MNTTSVSQEKIIIIDNVITGNNHLVINSGIINMAKFLFGNNAIAKEILFFGEKKHTSTLAKLVDSNESCKVSFHPVEVIKPKTGKLQKGISWIKKILKDKEFINGLLEINSDYNPKIVIISTISPFNLYLFINKINTILDQKFLIFLHGEVELIFDKNLSFSEKIKKYFLEKAFKKIPSNTQLVVFTETIKKALIDKFDFNDNQVITINHPILKFERNNFEISSCITFSHLGLANKRKNSELIFKLADNFDDAVNNDSCRFSIIGRLIESDIKHINPNVEIESKNDQPIPNERYIELISNADYSLIFLLEEEYVYRISGSLLDSIQFQIPIIALKHTFINELFEKGGDIGFVCDNYEEMQEVVNQIILKNPKFIDRYSLQVENLKKLSEKFFPENAAAAIIELSNV